MEIIYLSNVVVDDKSSKIFEHVLHTIYQISIYRNKIKQIIFNHLCTLVGGDEVSFVELLLLLFVADVDVELFIKLNGGNIGGGGGNEN